MSNMTIKTKAERGAELEEMRLSLNLTRYALAKLSGVTINAIAFIEQGKTSPSLETYEKLLTAMGRKIKIE